jgi:hypothetical protein
MGGFQAELHGEDRARTPSHASTTDTGSDASRVAALQLELNEARRSQRALAAKLVAKKGDSSGTGERFSPAPVLSPPCPSPLSNGAI